MSLDDAQKFAALDHRIHEVVARLSGNSILIDLVDSLHSRLSESRQQTSVDPTLRASTMSRLSELVEAIEAGDDDRAADVMRRHVTEVGLAAVGRPTRLSTS